MSGVFCVLTFALLFAIVIANTTSSGTKEENNGIGMLGKLASEIKKNCTLFLTKNDTGSMCDVLCYRPANLIEEMEAAIDGDEVCSLIGYHLRYDEPRTDKIGPGWFKTNATINKITIRDMKGNGQITDIEAGAFDDCTFRKMKELVIKRTNVTTLRRGVFEGANSLKKLILEENNHMLQIEEYTMDPLYQLEEIEMWEQAQFENLVNFTGSTQLKQLRSLTLRFNNFGSSINADTFRGCTSVETLILSNSLIQTIGIGAFDHMVETIRYLDLSYNQLKHLPSDLLGHLIRPNMQIFLSNNSWHCDCDSLQLQLWSQPPSSILDSPIICDMPPLVSTKPITEVDLSACYTNGTSSTDTTESPTTKGTDSPEPILERLNCLSEKESDCLYLEKLYQHISIKQLEMGKVSVELSSPDLTLSLVILNDKNEAECRYDLTRQMTFGNLDPNSVHQFCLMKKTSYATSPRNCFSFRFYDQSSIWGHDEIIIALVCSIVLSLVVGVLCGWLLSRRYQRVFRGKESFQYQSSARSTSKTATEIEEFNSSVTSDYIAGRYGGPNMRLRRTHSDNSIISCKSYITAVTPSPFEIIQWKLRLNAMKSNDLQVRDYLNQLECDNLAPELPPHPNRRHSDQIYETIDEPAEYTCTSKIVSHSNA